MAAFIHLMIYQVVILLFFNKERKKISPCCQNPELQKAYHLVH